MEIDIRTWCASHREKLSAFCRIALMHFAKAVKGGRIRIENRSNFLARADKTKKAEQYITLSGFDKDWLEKMAFTLKASQTEILRMALEWWKAVEGNNESAKDHWHTDTISERPSGSRFCLWSAGYMTLSHFPTKEEALVASRYS